jgi:regulatory protein
VGAGEASFHLNAARLVCRIARAWHRPGMTTETARDPPDPSGPDPFARPPPDAASLREAALNYLARYATTEAGLRRVLHRRVDQWARQASGREDASERAAEAKAAVAGIIARMVELGLLNDAVFAETRARGLALSGRSRRAISARLMAKGIDADRARAVLPEEEDSELISALILARKRRIGPFRKADPDQNREQGVLARAGFPRDVALKALEMDPEAAEDAIRVARA